MDELRRLVGTKDAAVYGVGLGADHVVAIRLLLARTDEGARLTREAYDYMEAFVKAAGGEDVRHPADLVLCASRLHSAVGVFAGLPDARSGKPE